ncbi:hypothetical protein DPMN_045185 [Dreissena polymorpha]|uniref:C2 domain-containing protein n=1 Tax=Dreissena polymorpha TaxID=45954 RepID=A0A9D4HZH4_DREPO|nr:hypothetical protein DPMN_045185 [Dreissena polymorpha]
MDATTEDQLPGNLYEVMVSCSELADLDEFTKSDPMCVLFHKQFGQWKEVCRTEAIRNTLNPKFVKSFILDFDHSLPQNLMFSVYDIDNSSTDLGDHDFVGSAEFSSSELIDPKLSICTRCKTLRVAGRSRGRGIISVTSERIVDCKEKVTLHAGAHKLNKRGRIISSKPDSYLEISRSIDNVSYQPVFRSETVFKSLHPRYFGLRSSCLSPNVFFICICIILVIIFMKIRTN